MIMIATMNEPLEIGRRVRVRRITKEAAEGVIVKGPLEHLRPVGEFYLIGKSADAGAEPWYRGSGHKSRLLITWQEASGAIGMYEREKITVL